MALVGHDQPFGSCWAEMRTGTPTNRGQPPTLALIGHPTHQHPEKVALPLLIVTAEAQLNQQAAQLLRTAIRWAALA